jgi:hypothetical protein
LTYDYNTVEGKLRYRIGDLDDTFPFLSGSVYTAVFEEKGNNYNRATIALASMVLAQMAFSTRRDMGLQLSVYSNQAFDQYKQFLMEVIKNPSFTDDLSIVAYGSTQNSEAINPILQFLSDWKQNYANGTESQQLADNALFSPNDGDTYGNTLGGYVA